MEVMIIEAAAKELPNRRPLVATKMIEVGKADGTDGWAFCQGIRKRRRP
jgi:hypothetical protein